MFTASTLIRAFKCFGWVCQNGFKFALRIKVLFRPLFNISLSKIPTYLPIRSQVSPSHFASRSYYPNSKKAPNRHHPFPLFISTPITMSFKSKILSAKPSRKILCYTLLLIFLPLLVALILALTILKPKHPITTINSVSLHNYNLSFDYLSMRPLLNLTLDLSVTVTNPNKVGFKYTHGSAFLFYKHQLVGYAPIPPGEVGAGGSESIRMLLTVFADRLVSDSELVGDLAGGEIVFVSVTKLDGKAVLMKLIRFKLSSETSCDLKVDVLSRSAENGRCKYKTKL